MFPRETELTAQLAQCQAALAEPQRENALLRQKVDLLVRRIFGASSEALDSAQLELLPALPASAALIATPVPPPSPELTVVRLRKERTPCWPDDLPVVEEVIEPERVKTAPQDWRCMGQKVSAKIPAFSNRH